MRPIIGKAKEVNEELKILCTVVENDYMSEKLLKKRFMQEAKGNYLNKESFSKVMREFGINGKVLQIAIANITVLSDDLQHLNFTRFLEEFELDY